MSERVQAAGRPCTKEHPAFSNGSEGYAWMELWCERCQFDHAATHRGGGDYENGCELLARAVLHDYPDEWTDHSETHGFTFPPAVVCSKFKTCDACGDYDGRNDAAVEMRVKLGGTA